MRYNDGMRKIYIGIIAVFGFVLLTGGIFWAREFASKTDLSARISGKSEKVATFTASGVFAATIDTDKVLNKLKTTQSDFHLALGDFSVGQIRPEEKWCEYMRSHAGTKIPFQIVTGNHESGGTDGEFEKFAECMPSAFKTHGTYGKEYYFDYPETDPLVRVIMISPNLNFKGASNYTYSQGSPQLTWLSTSIRDARTKNIPWVVAGMHKDCISPYKKSCDIGAQFFGLLINQGIDLILQSDSRIYARSKQISCIKAETRGVLYEESCVVPTSLPNVYTKGSGSVVAIVGTSGQNLNSIDRTSDSLSYFESYAGSNVTPVYGFSKFKVTKDEIRGEFIRAAGDDFSDTFIIKK
jgi:hypothetical protein